MVRKKREVVKQVVAKPLNGAEITELVIKIELCDFLCLINIID